MRIILCGVLISGVFIQTLGWAGVSGVDKPNTVRSEVFIQTRFEKSGVKTNPQKNPVGTLASKKSSKKSNSTLKKPNKGLKILGIILMILGGLFGLFGMLWLLIGLKGLDLVLMLLGAIAGQIGGLFAIVGAKFFEKNTKSSKEKPRFPFGIISVVFMGFLFLLMLMSGLVYGVVWLWGIGAFGLLAWGLLLSLGVFR